MTVEVRPLSDRCNLKCTYCYQEAARRNAVKERYSVEAIIQTLDELNEPFALFGGEALLVPLRDLERLFAYGFEKFGRNMIQTNGALANAEHVRLFERYNVEVGISLDGPAALNDARSGGSSHATRRATARSEALVEILASIGRPPRLIITLHKLNTSNDHLPILLNWIRYLDSVGISRVRLHLLQVDDALSTAYLRPSDEEYIAVLRQFRTLEKDLFTVRFDLFEDMRRMLVGADENVSCVWHACDPFATRGVVGVEGLGQQTNCGRTYKNGTQYTRSKTTAFERQLALYATAQGAGGCQGCRFFLMCKGNCPGTAISGEWRLRSDQCAIWYQLFEDIEQEIAASGIIPLSQAEERIDFERKMIEQWQRGVEGSLVSLLRG